MLGFSSASWAVASSRSVTRKTISPGVLPRYSASRRTFAALHGHAIPHARQRHVGREAT
ncbi:MULTISPECIES: hypothetical protein [Micromonospora]|uniref:hypothetical protein n=1 Tax=Micromonospora TaxID=1873 RepID=UPI001954D426|nr:MULTISPECIES: hypothetical protein [Micromonospora]